MGGGGGGGGGVRTKFSVQLWSQAEQKKMCNTILKDGFYETQYL